MEINTETDFMEALAEAIKFQDVNALDEIDMIVCDWEEDAAAKQARIGLLEATRTMLEA